MELTRQEAIEIIEEEDRGLSEEEENELLGWMDELKSIKEDEKEVIRSSSQEVKRRFNGSDAELKAAHKKMKRVVDHGLTPEEHEKLVKDYVEQQKRWEEKKAESTDKD